MWRKFFASAITLVVVLCVLGLYKSVNDIRSVRLAEPIAVQLPIGSAEARWIIPSDNIFSGGIPYIQLNPTPLTEVPAQALCHPLYLRLMETDFVFDCAWESDGTLFRIRGLVALPTAVDVSRWSFDSQSSMIIPHHKSWYALNFYSFFQFLIWFCFGMAFGLLAWYCWTYPTTRRVWR